MDLTPLIMLAGAGVSLGVIVNYIRGLRRHDQHVQVKIGDVEVSIKGPISTRQAQELVSAIGQSHAFEH